MIEVMADSYCHTLSMKDTALIGIFLCFIVHCHTQSFKSSIEIDFQQNPVRQSFSKVFLGIGQCKHDKVDEFFQLFKWIPSLNSAFNQPYRNQHAHKKLKKEEKFSNVFYDSLMSLKLGMQSRKWVFKIWSLVMVYPWPALADTPVVTN